MVIAAYLSKITLNVDRLNATIKIHRMTELDKKTRFIQMLPPRDPLQIEQHTQSDCRWILKGIYCE